MIEKTAEHLAKLQALGAMRRQWRAKQATEKPWYHSPALMALLNDPIALSAIGAGGGGLLGGLLNLTRDEEERDPASTMLTGALAGGAAGLGLGYGFPKIREYWRGEVPGGTAAKATDIPQEQMAILRRHDPRLADRVEAKMKGTERPTFWQRWAPRWLGGVEENIPVDVLEGLRKLNITDPGMQKAVLEAAREDMSPTWYGRLGIGGGAGLGTKAITDYFRAANVAHRLGSVGDAALTAKGAPLAGVTAIKPEQAIAYQALPGRTGAWQHFRSYFPFGRGFTAEHTPPATTGTGGVATGPAVSTGISPAHVKRLRTGGHGFIRGHIPAIAATAAALAAQQHLASRADPLPFLPAQR